MTIYCFIEEKNGKELDDFMDSHENDTIHLYSSVIESCEGNLFYCLGEIINDWMQLEGGALLVTDVKELYDIVKDIYRFLFEKIIYMEQGNQQTFSCGFDFKDLIGYFLELNRERVYYDNMKRLYEFKEKENQNFIVGNFYDMTTLNIVKSDADKVIWSTYCLLLLYEIKEETADGNYLMYRLALYSMLMELTGKSTYANKYLELVLSDKSITADNMYFVWNQYKRKSFVRTISSDAYTSNMRNELYDRAYNFYKRKLSNELDKIDKAERDKDLVLVCTIQFLDKDHAPTRSVIERVKALKSIGKKVFLVNTCEQYLPNGYLPFYNASGGNVYHEYDNIEFIGLDGDNFPFIQFSPEIPVAVKAQALCYVIRKIKPYYILSIGTGSMVADLCGNMVPCASMALVFSTFSHTKNDILIIGRNINEEERASMAEKDIVESRFTFELKKQKKVFTREDFNLPEKDFILVIVGLRLTNDIDEAFMKMLSEVCDKGCYAVFAGNLDNYDEWVEKYEVLAKKSSYIGVCDDVSALMEICDLYVNPGRIGGGFSVIEAFIKGKPGVYLRKGDVYAAGGDGFAVGNYDEMVSMILRYKEDAQFYEEMSKKAVARADLMTSSEAAVRDIDEKICNLIEEKYW